MPGQHSIYPTLHHGNTGTVNLSKDLSLPALPHPYQLCFACPGTFLTWVTMSCGASGHTQNGTAAPLDVAVQPLLMGESAQGR